MKINEATSSLW